MGLLQSTHLDVRMACGEMIAIVVECARTHDESFMDIYLPDLIHLTTELAKDSHKFRHKKDRKAQRASFRDVLRYLEVNSFKNYNPIRINIKSFLQDDVIPEIQVRFGNEILILDKWSVNIQYDKLCDAIGPGITTHLTDNEFLREIFQLGPKIVQLNGASINKQSKLERQKVNAAASKARTLSRKKNRDKRSAVFS